MVDREDRALRWATAAYVAGFLVHNADHARRGLDDVSEAVVWAGTVAAMLTAVAVVLVVVRHPSAPLAAAAIGLSQAVGYAVVHLTPEWSPTSDSFVTGSVDAWSWVASLAEITAALAFGLTGAWLVRRRGLASAVAS